MKNPINPGISAIIVPTKYGMPSAMLATSRGLAPQIGAVMRPHDTANRVVRIPLHSRKHPGLYAIVDEADAELVSQYRWHPEVKKHLTYAWATISPKPNRRVAFMHRLILGLGPGDPDVDHKDGDGLNNTRSNIRACSDSENQANRHRLQAATSRYRGVTWHKGLQKWQAQIKVMGTNIYLGVFDSEDVAALVYNDAAIKHFGEFARPNDVRRTA